MAPHPKKARKENAKIFLIDECGLLLAPLVRRTLAPRGSTPIMKRRGRHREKVSVIAAVGMSPKLRRMSLHFQTFPREYINHEKAADFLQLLLRHTRGKIIVVWDNGNMHRGEAIRRILSKTRRLHLESLPPYAPDCNPVEFLWKYIKYDCMPNFCPNDVRDTDREAKTHLNRAAKNSQKIRSFVNQSELAPHMLRNYFYEDQ